MAGGKAKRTGGRPAAASKDAAVKKEFNHDLGQVMESLLDNQRAALNSTESLVDVILILEDGVIPVHGVLLEAVSPFFRACFESQGPFYLGPREVLMPDFKMKTMQKVIQLVYNQNTYVQSECEADEIEKVMELLEINLTSGLSSSKVANVSAQKEITGYAPTVYKMTMGLKRVKSEAIQKFVAPDGKSIQLKDLSVGVPLLGGQNPYGARPAYVSTYRPRVSGVPRMRPNFNRGSSSGSSSEESATDSEMDEKAMKSTSWYMTKAKDCQKCKKTYPTAGEASTCLTSHNRLRCYFCFRVCKNTEMLFQHFARAHRKGGRENFVVCPCCEQNVPFKAVSCHVISMHLVAKNKQQQSRSNFRYRNYDRTNNTTPAIAAAGETTKNATEQEDKTPAAKKLKKSDGDLKVKDLECTIKHERANGKVWIFNIQKTRV